MAYTRKMAGKVPVLKQDLVFDATPTPGSENAVTSGAVAGSVAQQASNIAPNYTKKTYEANSYVMQGGVLYTNPNAIGTAEDWNPAHWTQTTVAEMIANIPQPQTGYVQRYPMASTDADGNYTVTGVKNRDVVLATVMAGTRTKPWKISIDDDCTDAFVILMIYGGLIQPSGIVIRRANGIALKQYGVKGQTVNGSIVDGGSEWEFTPSFNGIGRDPCSEVIIRICGQTALLSFTVA